MADNTARYGLRWYKGWGGRNNPVPVEMVVATANDFDVSSGPSNIPLSPGDLVSIASTGGVVLHDASTPPFGVVVGLGPYYDSAKGAMTFGSALPHNTAYGTNLERQTKVFVVPIDQGIWEVDVAATNSNYSTLALYQAKVGLNVSIANTQTTSNTKAWPVAVSSTLATTSTHCFRFLGLSPTVENQDFSGANVKILVVANYAQVSTNGNQTGPS